MTDNRVPKKIKTALTRQYRTLNAAQIRRDIHTLNDRLLKLIQTKQPARLPVTPPPEQATKRAKHPSQRTPFPGILT